MASRSNQLILVRVPNGRGGTKLVRKRPVSTPCTLSARQETVLAKLPGRDRNIISPETGWEKRLSREMADSFDVNKALKDGQTARAKISKVNKKRPKK